LGLPVISEIGVRELQIGERNGNLLEAPPTPLYSFKRPHLLRTLVVRTRIHRDLFVSLVSGTFNLSTLVLRLLVLTNLDVADLENLNFPRLRNLVLESGNFRDGALFLPNLRTSLRNNFFPRLKKLQITFPIEPLRELETIQVLVPFILRHRRTLRELLVEMGFPQEVNRFDGRHCHYRQELNSVIAEIVNHPGCPALQVFQVGGSRPYELVKSPQWNVWEELLKKTSSVEKIRLAIGPISDAILETTCSRNGSTLKEMIVSYQSENKLVNVSLNLSIFSRLECLKSLTLYGNRKLTHAGHLPPTLEFITLRGTLGAEDVAHILLHMPNIRHISLSNVHNHERERFEVQLETLQQFVRNRRVNSLSLAWSRHPLHQLPPEGISNGDPVNPVMLNQTDILYHGIHWILNREGYYCSCT